MKHVISIALGIFLMIASAPEAQAQGFLKGLADKAKDKVKEKVVKTVTGNNNNKPATAAPVQKTVAANEVDDNYNTEGMSHAELLAAPEEFGSLNRVVADIWTEPTPEGETYGSLAEAMKAFPALPTTNQVLTLDPAWVEAMRNHTSKTTNLMLASSSRYSAAIQSKNRVFSASAPKISDAQKKMMDQNAMQIFQLMQKYGIDPEKTSDKEMEAFVKKIIASGELKVPAGVNVADIQFDEEETENNYGEITEKVENLEEKVIQFLTAEGTTTRDKFNIDPVLSQLYNELQASWKGSEACKQVDAIEEALNKQLNEFYDKHPEYNESGVENQYPPFWTEARKKENAVINAFNTASLEKWNKPIKKVLDENMPILKEIEAIDAEVESTFPNKEDITYLLLKNKLTSSYQSCASIFQFTMEKIYNLPLVSTVVEVMEIIQ